MNNLIYTPYCVVPGRFPGVKGAKVWPFRPKERVPWIEEAFQRANVFALDLHRRLTTIEQTLLTLAEGIATARAMDRRVQTLEHGLRQTNASLQADVERLTSTIDVVRGLATGSRGGRPRNEAVEADRQALELGRSVIQRASTPEGRAQLILELQAAGAAPQIDAVGNPIRPPVRNGSPV